MQFFDKHKKLFPKLYKVAVGQLAHHTTTEVDGKSTFSQAGYLSDTTHYRTKTKTFEQVIIAKHRMHQIYLIPDKVKNHSLQITKDNMWDGELERYDRIFFELENKIYLDMFPHNEGFFENYGGNEAAL